MAGLALAAPTAAQADVSPLLASFENGGPAELSQASATTGSLTLSTDRAYDGSHSMRATYDGGGTNGYARSIQNISWPANADVWYGAAYYLPSGYMAATVGGNDILRWDNYGAYGGSGDYGAVELWSDKKAHLVLGKYSGGGGDIAPSFNLPEGRWFWLELHQKFSTVSGQALSEVYIDGQKVSSSTQANTYGRPADRLRFGIVCISEGKQMKPLTLYYDRASISTSRRGPLGSAPAPAPTPAPAPAPTPAPTPGPGGGSGGTTHHRKHLTHKRATQRGGIRASARSKRASRTARRRHVRSVRHQARRASKRHAHKRHHRHHAR